MIEAYRCWLAGCRDGKITLTSCYRAGEGLDEEKISNRIGALLEDGMAIHSGLITKN